MDKKPITDAGFKKIQDTLEKLKNIDRPKIIKEIKNAREFGDLKENAEYHAAKNEQSLIEKKIKEIENKIATFEVIDVKSTQDQTKISFGATIELLDLRSEKTLIYQIVGDDEIDIKNNKISFRSPLSKILISKSLNQIIDFVTPDGTLKCQIKNIKYI